MKRIAFIKFAGLSSGGTEISFQNVARHLSKEYEVDFFYCDSAPYIGSEWIHPDNEISRIKFIDESAVHLKKFNVEFKDITDKFHKWVNTDFWEIFNEKNYNLIFTTSAGAPEYPITEIKNTPIINIVTVNAGVNNQENILKTILITNESSRKWLKQGGDKKRLEVIPLLREEVKKNNTSFRNELNLNDLFIYGFHQRTDDKIFSDIPLRAFKKIEKNNNYFLILGGSSLYSKQAEKLGIKNFKQLEESFDHLILDKFLNTLDVFTHGRKHGETMGLVIAEAMSYGLPCISHKGESNGQKEVIDKSGKVFSKNNILFYSREMNKLFKNKKYYKIRSENALRIYDSKYKPQEILTKYENLVKQIIN